MRVSQLFTKTTKQTPADEVSRNAQLLIRAGFIYKEMAGVYAYLPLGKRVLDKIIQVIREEMDAIGGNEISLTALQKKSTWEASGRWDDEVMDVWFKTKLANGSDLGLAPTHEEPLTELMKTYISSYKDLPVYPYQFQIKFRNELRSKSGLMRGREFWMKDLYSFSRTQQEHEAFYEIISQAYHRVYERLGIGDITYRTFASGGSFAKYSHEFQTLSPVGEDTIYVHEGKRLAINEEVYNDEDLADLGVSRDELIQKTAVEVGNIFTLGTRFSDAFNLTYVDKDEIGLIWPANLAPFKVYLVRIGSERAIERADALYSQLNTLGVEVLYDDRNERPGVKFADSELMGIPYRITVSDRLVDGGRYELTLRVNGETSLLTHEEIIAKLS